MAWIEVSIWVASLYESNCGRRYEGHTRTAAVGGDVSGRDRSDDGMDDDGEGTQRDEDERDEIVVSETMEIDEVHRDVFFFFF